MITVNGQEINFREGMTVEDALREVGVSINTMTLVLVDKKVLTFNQLNSEILVDGSDIKLLMIISGG